MKTITMDTSPIVISQPIYELLTRKARQESESPDHLAEAILRQQLVPEHAYVEVVSKPTGQQAVIKGTRIPVSVVIGYLRIGETPDTLTAEIMPHLTLAQIYDTLSYYHDHRYEIDQEISQNSEEWGRAYLREHLGEDDYLRISGQKT